MPILQIRAQLFATIRQFFAERSVLEVDTPLLALASIPDPHVHSFQTDWLGNTLYLQTSPEFSMKRLLVDGSGSIYQICKAFRHEEVGRFHQPEFTMLEWYRVGFSLPQLMQEVESLVQTVLPSQAAVTLSYQGVFEQYLNLNPHIVSCDKLKEIALQHQLDIDLGDDKNAWLDLLFTHVIEPQLAAHDLVFIHRYPAAQAALAKLDPNNPALALRFELYVRGVEIANGFHELQDAVEQRQRFENENQRRFEQGLPLVPLDEAFLLALEKGLPDCCGVALGVDRLLMLMTEAEYINDVLNHPL
ncbi:MAG: elongation factor P--(R)-beta-lysine ligase [marine bacterium B5-7]|nr:MAG: elongation factor P--(R)-beta-lysine ligase [marine bacterium B5-7]